jgi:hypothetical protein
VNPWYYLWMAVFVVSTLAFASIAVVVVIRGVSDLKMMLRGLQNTKEAEASSDE